MEKQSIEARKLSEVHIDRDEIQKENQKRKGKQQKIGNSSIIIDDIYGNNNMNNTNNASEDDLLIHGSASIQRDGRNTYEKFNDDTGVFSSVKVNRKIKKTIKTKDNNSTVANDDNSEAKDKKSFYKLLKIIIMK